jgi:DNA-binding IclR family transcriptional regulator
MNLMVARTLDFLELFAAEQRPLSSTDIARLLHLAASSCHDVVHVLASRGYLYKSPQRAVWYPTWRLLEVARTIAANDPVVARMLAPLRQLRDAMDESVLLAKIDGLEAMYLLALEPSHPLRYLSAVGERVRALHATSTGKALLGSLSDVALNGFLESADLTPHTPLTIVSAVTLRQEIAAGNERGWFASVEESEPGLTMLSVRFNRGSAFYIVTLAGPTRRLQPRLGEASQLLTRVCRELASDALQPGPFETVNRTAPPSATSPPAAGL